MSPRGYVKSSWNLLDALAVLGSIGSEIVSIGNDQNDAFTALRTIRCLRILRSVRLVRFVPALRRMFSVPLDRHALKSSLAVLHRRERSTRGLRPDLVPPLRVGGISPSRAIAC